MNAQVIWLDNHLSPALADWISGTFSITCLQVRSLGLERAEDARIFGAARDAGAIVMTKDADFVGLIERLGSPPAVILLTCGNTSDAHLRVLLLTRLPIALDLIRNGESLVEIGGAAA